MNPLGTSPSRVGAALLVLAAAMPSCGSSGSASLHDAAPSAPSDARTDGTGDSGKKRDASGDVATGPADASDSGRHADASTDGTAAPDSSIDAGPQGCALAAQTRSCVGCEFYAVAPDTLASARGACFAAFLSNPSSAPVTFQVDFAGTALDPSTFTYLSSGDGAAITYAPISDGQIPPGKTAIVFLSSLASPALAACPSSVGVAYAMDPSVTDTGMGNAFHITASAPVSAYDTFPYGGGQAAVTSATLLLPVATWDTSYIAVDAYAAGMRQVAYPPSTS